MGINIKIKITMHSFCKTALALGFKDICKDNVDTSAEFLQHVAEFGLSYGTQQEYLFRQEIFNARDAEYKVINADKNNTFTVGHNFMSTWTNMGRERLHQNRRPKNWTRCLRYPTSFCLANYQRDLSLRSFFKEFLLLEGNDLDLL